MNIMEMNENKKLFVIIFLKIRFYDVVINVQFLNSSQSIVDILISIFLNNGVVLLLSIIYRLETYSVLNWRRFDGNDK